ncbi:hypothetical protein H6P81_002567 [Aristolochia fimbriata]|uniref:VWFA domain-containing protein n=1 Tax=Aristolochia fimbriata TaxID=158543 RepID=A0AAV7FBT8_ARIFI|nr:hypothetical protein H6P81_002567 [Aristolochia fimbriata]
MDPTEFSKSVESGLKLAKRIYLGKDRSLSPPKPPSFDKSESYQPTAPMIYAVISDPAIVDNPDVPSYQPHVHGRCDPPALIPLQMNEIQMNLDCYFNTVFVTVAGSWRVHCVMGSRSCDCRLVVPLGEQGSILGVDIDVAGRSYSTQLMRMEDTQDKEKSTKLEDGKFLRPQIFSLKVPKVDGGSVLSVKIRWRQQLLYNEGQFSIAVPFSFPDYVNPSGKMFASSEKIQLNVNTGMAKGVIFKTISHALKETRRQMGRFAFLYDAQVLQFSSADFNFTFEVPSSSIFGGLILQSPSLDDLDQREMFCLYLYPGKAENTKIFRKEVVFLVDISESMHGKPLESVQTTVLAAISKFTSADSFNIIAFNGESHLFSSSLEPATVETIERASRWMTEICVVNGGTNILDPLNQAMEMLSGASCSCPQIFLITDGAVDEERNICDMVKTQVESKKFISPRIFTFGVGSNCNHYFLQMLASISRGRYHGAFVADILATQLHRFITTSSAILTNIAIDIFDDDAFEVFPFYVPDLLSGYPVVVSGRYEGSFPDSVRVKGFLPDKTNIDIDLKVQQAKDIPLDKVLAKQQIDLITSQAWLSESKELQEKVVTASMQSGIVSEHTRMVLLRTDIEKIRPGKEKEAKKLGKKSKSFAKDNQVLLLSGLTIGFGNIAATNDNIPPFGETNQPESDNVLAKTVRNIGGLCDCCCCFCCIRGCSKINDQCAIALTQLCTALSCFGCLSCCMELCGNAD